MSRNRIIYQSKALFIGPNSTGVQTWASGAATAAAWAAAEAIQARGRLVLRTAF